MLTTLKNNKRDRKSAFDKLKKTTPYDGKLELEKKATKKQLDEIKNKLQRENKNAFIENAAFIILILSILVYFFAFHKY